MEVIYVGVLAAILFLSNGAQNIDHPDLSEGFSPASYEVYEPKAGPDCGADAFSVRSDCSR